MSVATLLLCVMVGACSGATHARVAPEQTSQGRMPVPASPPRGSASGRAHAPPSDTTPPIRTDRTGYVLRKDSASGVVFRAPARVTYTNRRSIAVYLDGCSHGAPNMQVGAVGPPMRDAGLLPLCGQTAKTPYIRVGPGQTRTYAVTLQTNDRSLPEEGPFRVLITVYTRPQPTPADRLPRSEGWSNPFWIRLEG